MLKRACFCLSHSGSCGTGGPRGIDTIRSLPPSKRYKLNSNNNNRRKTRPSRLISQKIRRDLRMRIWGGTMLSCSSVPRGTMVSISLIHISHLPPHDLTTIKSLHVQSVLNPTQTQSFHTYLQNGGNFIGVHSASDCLMNQEWFVGTLGARFDYHPDLQEAVSSGENVLGMRTE
jgi:hypothetical protein